MSAFSGFGPASNVKKKPGSIKDTSNRTKKTASDDVRKRGQVLNRRRRRKMNRKPLEIQAEELLKKY